MNRDACRICCALLLVLATAHARPAKALVVAGVTSANASAPADDPGWANVGDTAISVGGRWVLTAYHVGVNPVTFPGVGTFNPAGGAFRLKNPTGMGLSTYTDLLMYQIDGDPGLPSLSIASATPGVDENVLLIGDGNAILPDTAETSWTVTEDEFEPNPDWAEGGSTPNYFGYKSNTRTKLWGTNIVEDNDVIDPAHEFSFGDHNFRFDIGFGDVLTFGTEFDKPGETAGLTTDDEAQALAYDSGSAVFHKVDGIWQLAGVTDAIGTFTNQPNALQSDVGQTAVFGNATFYVDLSFYRDQILAVPEAGAFLLMGAVGAAAGLGRLMVRRRR